jgi:hypothetical protein
MALLEKTMNIPLCGIFLIFLSAMCLDAFSIITVSLQLKPSCKTTYLPIISKILNIDKKWLGGVGGFYFNLK